MIHTLSSLPGRNITLYRPNEPSYGLNATLINAGHEIRTHEEDYDWDGNKRGSDEMFIWQYTFGGRGKLKYETKEYDITPGDAMLLKVPELHRYWLPEDSEKWEFIYITVAGSEMIRLGLDARCRLGIVVRHAIDSQVVRTAASIISAGFNRRIKTRFDSSRRAYSFMMDLLAETAANAQTQNETAMEKAREYCLTHISEPIDVENLAKAANLSRWHFSRCFQKASGISPHRYILETKMGLAAHLLLNSSFSVKEIATQCGYLDASYFCKSFKLIHGISPGMFRAM